MATLQYKYDLDMGPGKRFPTIVKLSQYDEDFELVFRLHSEDGALDVRNATVGTVVHATTAEIRGTKSDGNGYSATCDVGADTDGTPTVTFVSKDHISVDGDKHAQQMTAVAGKTPFELTLYHSETESGETTTRIVSTGNFLLEVERAPLDLDTLPSDSKIRELYEIDDHIDDIIDAADTILNAIDPTLTVQGAAADAKVVGDTFYKRRLNVTPYPFARYLPVTTPFSIVSDMPNMTTYVGIGGDITIDDSFPYSLSTNITYRIIKYYQLVTISSPGSGEIYVGSISSGGTTLWTRLYTDNTEPVHKVRQDAVQVYVERKDMTDKVYSGTSLIDVTSSHGNIRATELFDCLPSTQYYITLGQYEIQNTLVVFFDANKKAISKKGYAELASYTYENADGTGSPSEYDYYNDFKTFTTPSNARFFAFNVSINPSLKWKFCVSTVPVLLRADLGFKNVVIEADDPILHKADKTLAVIGPSGVMNDRRLVSRAGYINGFQEHLIPYYKEVISWGYSSRAYATGADYGIYDFITQGVTIGEGEAERTLPAKDFANIDEVLLIQSGTGLRTLELGNAGGIREETVDPSTKIGAIRGIVQYILAQNPKCKIYLASFYKYNNTTDPSAAITKALEMNEASKTLCDALGLTYIDLWSNVPFNYSNYFGSAQIYSYDGGHANSLGNKEIADVLLRYMLP